jgi:hypothetical protein
MLAGCEGPAFDLTAAFDAPSKCGSMCTDMPTNISQLWLVQFSMNDTTIVFNVRVTVTDDGHEADSTAKQLATIRSMWIHINRSASGLR